MIIQLSTKNKINDAIVVFASGVASFFGGISLILISVYLRQVYLITHAIQETPALAETQKEPLVAAWCCVAECLLFAVLGIFNLIYAWRYMRNQRPKTAIGFIATFGAFFMTIALMVGYIMTHFGAKINYIPVFMETNATYGAGFFIYYIFLFVVAMIAQLLNIIFMFIWEDPSADKIVNITQTTPGAIMLDEEDLKREEKTPPLLNANPDAPIQVGGHKIKK